MRLACIMALAFSSGLSFSASACDIITEAPFAQDKGNNASVCIDISDSLESLVDQIREISIFGENEKKQQGSYWTDWAFKLVDEPIISARVEKRNLGIGFWSPHALEDMEDIDYGEWLLNQGVQLSMGIGNARYNEPRVRVDYRWHQDTQVDVLLQVELPF